MAKRMIGDPNLVASEKTGNELQWHDPRLTPFAIDGLPWLAENKDYGRLPLAIRPELREPLAWVAMQPSGVAIRFRSDSKTLALKVIIDRNEQFSGNSLMAESGFDIYLGSGHQRHFYKNLCAVKPSKHFSVEITLPDGEHDICIYFPILNPIKRISVGLSPDASLSAAKGFSRQRILFYGSSITQGFSCSRPGLTYPARVCRSLDAELVNMGFGGNAKGDPIIAETFAKLLSDGSYAAFVYDYDHNTPNPEWLRQTHEAFFKIIRKQNPRLPILVLSSPIYHRDPAFFGQRHDVIAQTVTNAKQTGDKKVRLLAGKTFWPRPLDWRECTVDLLHPNDQGFALMADGVSAALTKMLD